MLSAFAVACGGAPSHAAEPSRETEACRGERLAILEAATRSREQACSTDADCVAVTNPGHPSEEVQVVVHRADGPALEARAGAHLARCGAFMHREAIDAFVVVKPSCAAGRCVATETTFHVE